MRAKRRGARSANRIGGGLRFWISAAADGTTALPPPQRCGSPRRDIARNLVDRGTNGPAALGLTNCRFQQGTPRTCSRFQIWRSTWSSASSAHVCPPTLRRCQEMVRVTSRWTRRHGNWIPTRPHTRRADSASQLRYTPPPPEGFVAAMTWGVESNVIERFAGAGIPAEKISFARDTFHVPLRGSPPQFVDEFRNTTARL